MTVPSTLAKKLSVILYKAGETKGDGMIVNGAPKISFSEWTQTQIDAEIGPLLDALTRSISFIDKTAGTALALAMSGRAHPNPDTILRALSREGMALSSDLCAILDDRAASPTIGEKP